MTTAVPVRSEMARSLQRALWMLATMGVALTVLLVALLPIDEPGSLPLIVLPVIFVIYLVAGGLAWRRRPRSDIGFLIVIAGMAVYAGSLFSTEVPALVAIGSVCATLMVAAIVHLLLAFPTGRLPDRLSVFLVVATYAVCLVMQAPLYLFDADGPFPPFALADLPRAAEFFSLLQTIVASALMVWVAWVLWGRLRRADAAHRRVLVPLFSYGIFTVLFMPLIAIVLDRVLHLDPTLRGFLQFGVIAGIPIAFALGTIRGGFARTGELEELGAWLGGRGESGEPLGAALQRALGDPSLRLYFRAADRAGFVDVEGHPADDVRRSDPRRGWQPIMLDGREIGAIEYDAELFSGPGRVRAAGSVVAIEVERERLTAELRASQRELRQSRERLVEASDRERRRVARDLHDGLQVQLVLLALEAQQIAAAAPETVPDRATRLRVEIDAAAADLRALVSALVPAALIERGLEAAAEDLADRMPIPTHFEADLPGAELGDLVEATTYFVLTEALANVVKHAKASVARVRLARRDGLLRLDVEDDGVGGASMDAGTGLRGLADRVEAIGGTISVTSRRGHGTHVRAEVPCA
ncbi:sensor histidine kinase [Microbacterium sp. NEAU-LLC]|uniref:histidine kinase n=1 Tax=Microbacterium helvum TaxID=2773713 RepID=A0ABR8NQX0_9MICO|nr:ATP-binding protein [Microbacterium helvum]MBD3943040.1 sensor histidine kinase [Microbacterium helvum]